MTYINNNIQMLRAIAVISVVAYHYSPSYFPYGYWGVDLFFIISGYLINKILNNYKQSLSSNFVQSRLKFTKSFLLNRIAKIYPPYIFVLCLTLIILNRILTYEEFDNFRADALRSANLFGIQNYYNYIFEDYFSDKKIHYPLMHFWSLGVELYLYLTMFLIAIFIIPKYWNSLFYMLLLLSLFYSFNAGYYDFGPRLFTFISGVIVGEYEIDKFQAENSAKFTLWILLLCLIFYGLVVDPARSILIMVFVIFILKSNFAYKNVLLNTMFSNMAKISYELYLLHWPLLSIASIVAADMPSKMTRLSLLLFAIVVSFVLHHYYSKFFIKHRKYAIYFSVGALTFFLILLTSGYLKGNANIYKMYEGDFGHKPFYKDMRYNFDLCNSDSYAFSISPVWNGSVRCWTQYGKYNDEIAVIGDSHAEHLLFGLKKLEIANLQSYVFKDEWIFNEEIINGLVDDLNHKKIKYLILSNFWSSKSVAYRNDLYIKALEKLLNIFKAYGFKVIIVGSTPNFNIELQGCIYKRFGPFSGRCDEIYYGVEPIDLNLKGLIGDEVYYLDGISPFLTNNGSVSYINKNYILFRDGHHFNRVGSEYFMGFYRDRLEKFIANR